MTRTALYRHYDADDRLLYVGVSSDPTRRTYEHKCRTEWASCAVRKSVEWHETRRAAEMAERQAITDEAPLYNKRGFSTAEPTALSAYLDRNGISQRQFALSVGMSPTHIGDVVRGIKTPGLEFALLIHEATDREVSLESMIARRPEPTQ